MKLQMFATLMTMVLALTAQAEGRRLIVVMKSKDAFKAANLSLNTGVKVEDSLNNINTVIVKVGGASQIAQLKANPNVVIVEEEMFHQAPAPMNGYSVLGAPSRHFQAARFGFRNGGFQVTDRTPWGILAVRAIDAWGTSNQGQGARVLVLDTGIDKDHPALAANFEKGQNFVTDNPTPYPYMDTIGHGTHVSGTIAGVADTSGFTGVAPKAKILMGRVCSNAGCPNTSIAKGLSWGLTEKVDVISMSLGGAWSTPAERDAISKAYKAGITIVAASGNDGTNRVSYPAALPEVIAVGAVDNKSAKATFSQYGPELAIVAPGVDVNSSVPQGTGREADVRVAIGSGSLQKVKGNTFVGSAEVNSPVINSLVDAGLGKPEDFANRADIAGKFALIQRGEIKFGEKVQNAINAKAAGVVIYNNVAGLIQGSLTDDGSVLPVPVFMVEQTVGEDLKAALAAGQQARAQVAVIATDYANFDGTSMATPHVSGVVALIKATNKSLTPSQVRDLIKRTATALGPNTNNEFGAGLINADAAVREAAGSTNLH